MRQILDPTGSPRCDCRDPICKDVGKHPRVRWSTEATNDEDQVKQLWDPVRGHPNDSVGVATGEKSGVWVLDVDPKNGGHNSLAELEKQHGKLPRTISVLTGSGGLHIYFAYPGSGYRSTAGVVGIGLDTRGDGGFVVGPGSPHKSGRSYVFINGPADTALAAAPDWLLTLASTASPKKGRSNGRAKKEKQGLHLAPVPRSEATALLEIMLEHPVAIWMREYPDEVDRETWRGVAQSIACAVTDYPDLLETAEAAFQELSEDYSGYSFAQTERTFRDAVISAQEFGPMSFAHQVQNGMPPELWTLGATNLLHAARQTLWARRGGAR